VNARLDLARLEALPAALGVALPEIVATLIGEIDGALTSAQTALATGDLRTAALAAHTGRNSALMLGPGPMLDALGELEVRANGDDSAGADTALREAQALWPPLRKELERAGRPQL
jgi:hypothetical protein